MERNLIFHAAGGVPKGNIQRETIANCLGRGESNLMQKEFSSAKCTRE